MDAVEYLQEIYDIKKKRNPLFSIRSFAERSGLSSGAMSQILSRKRTLTLKTAMKISAGQILSQSQKNKLIHLLKDHTVIRHSSDKQKYKLLRKNLFRVISEWYHFAILSLMKTKLFIPDSEYVARRLGLSVVESENALRRLERFGFIKRTKDDWTILEENTKTTSDIPSRVIRDFHENRLNIAIHKLHNLLVEDKDFSSMTFSCQQKDIQKIKNEIKNFRRNLVAKYETAESDEVYNLNIQLFKITK